MKKKRKGVSKGRGSGLVKKSQAPEKNAAKRGKGLQGLDLRGASTCREAREVRGHAISTRGRERRSLQERRSSRGRKKGGKENPCGGRKSQKAPDSTFVEVREGQKEYGTKETGLKV